MREEGTTSVCEKQHCYKTFDVRVPFRLSEAKIRSRHDQYCYGITVWYPIEQTRMCAYYIEDSIKETVRKEDFESLSYPDTIKGFPIIASLVRFI